MLLYSIYRANVMKVDFGTPLGGRLKTKTFYILLVLDWHEGTVTINWRPYNLESLVPGVPARLCMTICL